MSETSDQPTTPSEAPTAENPTPDQAPAGQPHPRQAELPATRAPGADLRHVAIGAGAVLLVLAFGGVVFAVGQLARPDVTAVAPQHVTSERDIGPHRRDVRGRAAIPERLRERLEHSERRGGRRDGGIHVPGGRPLVLPEITISAISGSDITLTTESGWTRTVTLTDATTISKAGETIALADLKIGDQVRFRQQRNDDGTYSITALEVVLPRVVGEVTAIDGDTITVVRRDGTSATVHLGTATTYHVRGVENATLADISVGMVIGVLGEQNADGSLQALAVHAAAER